MPGQLYKLDSSYGSEQQLTELLTKLRDSGIDPLADIVINHRCGYSHSCAIWLPDVAMVCLFPMSMQRWLSHGLVWP
jgi:hypothetical protein